MVPWKQNNSSELTLNKKKKGFCLMSSKDTEKFNFSAGFEEGRDRCPYDPAKGFTGLLIGTSLVE